MSEVSEGRSQRDGRMKKKGRRRRGEISQRCWDHTYHGRKKVEPLATSRIFLKEMQPTAKEQRRLVEMRCRERVRESSHVEGERFYAVRKSWMARFLDFLLSEGEEEPPGPVDNSEVPEGPLPHHAFVDFSLVPASVWRLLQEWYGGGPERCFRTVELLGRPLLLFDCVELTLEMAPTRERVRFPVSWTLHNLQLLACSKFQAEEGSFIMWHEDIPLVELHLTLLDVGIGEGAKIVLRAVEDQVVQQQPLLRAEEPQQQGDFDEIEMRRALEMSMETLEHEEARLKEEAKVEDAAHEEASIKAFYEMMKKSRDEPAPAATLSDLHDSMDSDIEEYASFDDDDEGGDEDPLSSSSSSETE